MILRRYGNRVESVDPDFDPAAMNEVGFRRNGEFRSDLGAFLDEHQMVRTEEITAEYTDPIQERSERLMLEVLREKLDGVLASLEEGEILSVESETGKDYPRTRYERSSLRGGEFTYTLDRPLRLGIWTKRPEPPAH